MIALLRLRKLLLNILQQNFAWLTARLWAFYRLQEGRVAGGMALGAGVTPFGPFWPMLTVIDRLLKGL